MSYQTMQSVVGRFTVGAQKVGRGLGNDTVWMASLALVLAAIVVLGQLLSDARI